MVKNIQAVLLAAGSSQGSQTNTTKLVHKICGQEVVLYPLTLLQALKIATTIVVGHQKDRLEETIQAKGINTISFVHQPEQNGTADAVACARHSLTADTILVMNADTPLVTQDIIETLIATHREHKATISFVVAHNAEPSGYSYGRLVNLHNTMSIVPSHAFSGDYHEHCLVDAGIYLIEKEFLLETITQLKVCTRTGETHLSDLIGIASEKGLTLAITHAPFDRIRSIDTLQDLWAAEHIKRSDLIREWMSKGVRFTQPQTAHLDLGITIGKDSVIGAGVHLLGSTNIGQGCVIREFCTLEDCEVKDNVTIFPHCYLNNVSLENNSLIQPFTLLVDQTKNPTYQKNFDEKTFIGAIKTHDHTHYHETT